MKGVRLNSEVKFRPRPANILKRPGMRTAILCVMKFIAAFLLCGGEIFGVCRPFGVAFVAAAGAGFSGFFALLGAALGYTAFMGFYAGMRYSIATLLIFFIAFVVFDRPVSKKEFFVPIVAGICSFAMGLLYLVSDMNESNWVYLISETVLTVGCAYFFSLALKGRNRGQGGPRDLRHSASLLILTATILITLASVTLIANISVGRLLATLIVMASAYTGGVGAGSAVGTITGIAMDVAAAQIPMFTMAYAFSGLLSGIFKSQGRLSFTLSYILANAAAVFWTNTDLMRTAILYEVFVASVIFMLLPEGFLMNFSELTDLRQGRTMESKTVEIARRKLERTASAFYELKDMLRSSFQKRKNDNNIATVFDRAADKVCRRCVMMNICWQKEYENTKTALNDITPQLVEHGSIARDDYPQYFSARCVKLSEFTNAINEEYKALLRRRQQQSRSEESREIVCTQYAELATALRRAAAEMSEELMPDEYSERRISQYLKAKNVNASIAVYRDSAGRLRAELEGKDLDALVDDNMKETFSQLMRVRVGEPERIKSGKSQRIIVSQAEPLAAIAGGASRSREGQNVSGDSATYFKNEDGKLYLILTDGMGSGEGADRESRFALRMLERFLRAEMDPQTALKTMNNALLLSEQSIVTAVDLLSIDLFTGDAGIYKYGAAPTYIKRGKTVRRMDGRAMAAGSGADGGEPDALSIELEPKDYIVMLSDGVCDGIDDDWLRDCIAEFEGDSPNELSNKILEKAVECGGAVDDMTIMSLRLIKREI